MAWTQSDLDALNEAIALGARRVEYEDKEIEYPSLASMLNLRAAMEADLGIEPDVVKRRVQQMDRGVR